MPRKAKVLQWSVEIWNEFPKNVVTNAFKDAIFIYNNNLDLNAAEQETDSDASK